ncbi:BUD13 -like protein [Channa argus]|uniref:BUD13 homolog n=1 Tax=Channa argus TaxID=215402 RepID=A0A6G1QUZ7_CHAAH|nr:BUD13 -like protein [Channa argus]
MAALAGSSKGTSLSKTEYLKRYLSAGEDAKKSQGKLKKKRRKVSEKGLKIVDDDIDWKQMVKEEKEIEEDEEEAPVIAEIIDDRPEEVKQLEAFRTSNRWKVIGDEEINTEEGNEHQYLEPVEPSGNCHDSSELLPKKRQHDIPVRKTQSDSPETSIPRGARHDSLDMSSSKRVRHDSPDISPTRRGRHDSPDISPPRRGRHDSPDISPPRRGRHDSPDISPPRRRGRHDSPDISPPRRGRHDSPSSLRHSGNSGKVQGKESSPTLRIKARASKRSPDLHRSPQTNRAQNRHDSDSDQSPPRRLSEATKGSDTDQSPPRRRPQSGKDLNEDRSPPHRHGHSQGQRMLSGGKAGLVSVDCLRKEQEENRRRERNNQPLEDESRNAQTVFRDKSGKKRDLDTEREEQKRKAGEKAAKDQKYAQWGKGLAQGQMQQQKLEDALHEAQKPLARHYDDEDLDRMLREQEREGDPMAAMLRRKKDRNTKTQEKPRYKGPAPPPNRFNIQPGYRWDGVDRSNGFEQKRYMRMADKKAGQEAAYKWSVEDM